MLKVIKIDSLSDVKNEVLHERTKRAQGGRSQEFIAMVNGVESGLLSYENWSDQSIGFVYEIFVLPGLRRQGIGRALLSYAENLAIQLGCTYIRLKPYALDHDTDQELLASWYVGSGYAQKANDKEVMEKNLATA